MWNTDKWHLKFKFKGNFDVRPLTSVTELFCMFADPWNYNIVGAGCTVELLFIDNRCVCFFVFFFVCLFCVCVPICFLFLSCGDKEFGANVNQRLSKILLENSNLNCQWPCHVECCKVLIEVYQNYIAKGNFFMKLDSKVFVFSQ